MSDNIDVATAEGIRVRSAAFIAKYAERDADGNILEMNLPILQTCVHPANRGFVYTQGKAVETLFRNILIDGFDKPDISSRCVAIRERPVTLRPVGYEPFLDFNIRKSLEDDLLAGAYLPTDAVIAANVNHCHGLQLGRAVLRRLKFKIEFDHALGLTGLHTCDSDGRLSVSALAAHKNGMNGSTRDLSNAPS